MSDQRKPSRIRAVFRNALTWGVIWGGLGSAVATVFRLADNITPLLAVLDGIGMGVRIGVVGALAGGAFAAFMGLAYRGKRLSEISAARFGIGGAVLAGAFVPAWMQTMSLLTGGGFVPLNLITDDIVLSTVFGGITAAGTMILAQRDEAKNPVTMQEIVERMESPSLGEGSAATFQSAQRSHSTES